MTEEQLTQDIQQEEEARKPGWGRLIAWVVVLGLLALVAVQLKKAQEGTVQAGQPAPAFDFVTFDGEEISAADREGKLIVVNFWASWCKPCEQEAADLQTAWELYEPRGDVIFLGVDYVDTKSEALGYLEKFGITYLNGPDLRTATSQAFRIRGVPETFIIDQTGTLVYVKIGPFVSLNEIRTAIEPYLP